MNSLNSLYFPGTTLYSFSQYPLFLLFSRVHLLKPAEHNIHGNGAEATDSFIKADLCQIHIPSPLGKDLKRFTHLINDIKNRRDDYASQLSALTLSTMPNYSRKSGDSQQEITSSLLSDGRVFPDKLKEQKNMELWQARLILAMGEILDQEEEDIARQFAVLKDEEAELFKKLQGEDDSPEEDNPFEELSLIRGNMNQPTPDNMKKRFFSWKQLYKEGDIPTCDLLLTTSRDCADRILESFGAENNEKAIYPGQLSLPAIISWHKDDALQQIHSFREKNREIIAEITERLLSLKTRYDPTEENSSESILSSYREPWEKSLESHFPTKQFGRIPLSFYCFADTPCPALLGADKQSSFSTNGLMAVADIASGRP